MCSIRLHKDFTKASARESDIGREGERTVWDRCSLTKSKQCWVGVGISIEYCTATVTDCRVCMVTVVVRWYNRYRRYHCIGEDKLPGVLAPKCNDLMSAVATSMTLS